MVVDATGAWRPGRWYRGTLYQAIVLGLVSFTQAGIWDALNSTGAGGLASPYFVNASNVITYTVMIIASPVFAIACDRWNLKWVLVVGTLGYVPYFAALYCNSAFGTQWFLLVGSVTCGISAAALWVSEATIAVGYPEPGKHGTYIAIWMSLNKIGSIIGNSVQLALNIGNSEQGSINPVTYLVMIAAACTGLPLALTLSTPQDLIREDGSKPRFSSSGKPESLAGGFRRVLAVLKLRSILILLPAFITFRWSSTYQGLYLTAYFTVRGRAVASFISTIIATLTTVIWGWLLDSKTIFRSKWLLANVGWWIILATYTMQWIFHFVLQLEMQSEDSEPVLDIVSPGYVRGIGAYCLYSFGSNATVVWLYWVLATYDSHIDTLAYKTAVLRNAESIGFAISFGIGANSSIHMITNLVVAFLAFCVSVPFTTYATWQGNERFNGADIRQDSCDDGEADEETRLL